MTPSLPKRFEIQGRLGEGGFGAVFEAFDRERREKVALKLLHHRQPAAVYRFKREFRAISELTHPNLVTLHELFHSDGSWFFTMELVEGRDFVSHVADLERPAPISESTITAGTPRSDGASAPPLAAKAWTVDRARLEPAALQLVEAVQAIHRRGLLHLDLKPTNVLVTASGRVVVLDFGLVHYLFETTEGRRGPGTPAYMAPEQKSGASLSTSTDWYAVGGLLYETLTGQIAAMVEPDENAADPLQRVCWRMMRRDPARRTGPGELRSLLSHAAEIVRPDEPKTLFAGRRTELERLQRAFERAAEGRPVVARVVGTSGIGKSALCRQLVDSVAAQALILESRCYEQEHLPHKALDAVVDALARATQTMRESETADRRALARLFPVFGNASSPLAGDDAVELRTQASSELRDLLQKVALARPTVVFIDDLHWGDLDSLQLLREMLAPASPLPVLFLLSHRPGDTPVLVTLDALLAEAGVNTVELQLHELSVGETAEMMAGLAGEGLRAGVAAEVVFRETGGVPFLIDLLVREGITVQERSMADVLQRRIDGIDEPARTLLEVLAVAGQPMAPRLLGAAAGLDAPTALLGALRRHSLVSAGRTEESRVECYHDRIRAALLAQLSVDKRRRHHLGLAEALLGSGQADPEQVFIHLDASGEGRRAASFALTAADRAAGVFAFDRAISLYEAALHWPDAHSDLWTVKKRLADALFNAGRTTGAGPAYLAAATLAPADERAELERRSAEASMLGGEIDAGMGLLEARAAGLGASLRRSSLRLAGSILYHVAWLAIRGTRLGDRGTPELLHKSDLHWSIGRGLAFVRPLHGVDHILRSLARALTAGDRGRVARSLSFVAGGVFFQITALRKMARRLLAQAEELARELADPLLLASASLWRGPTEIAYGHWESADAQISQALRALERDCQGVHWERSVAAGLDAWLHQHRGDLQASRQIAQRYFAEAEARGDLYGQVLFRQYLAFSEIAADRPAETRRHARWIVDEWCKNEFSVPGFYAAVLEIFCDLYEERPGEARQRWGAAQPPFRRAGGHLAPVSRIENNILEARLIIREGASNGRRMTRLQQQLAREERRDGAAWAAWVDAARQPSEQSMESVARGFERCGLIMAAACADWHTANLRGDSEARSRAEEILISLGAVAPARWVPAFLPIASR